MLRYGIFVLNFENVIKYNFQARHSDLSKIWNAIACLYNAPKPVSSGDAWDGHFGIVFSITTEKSD